MKYSFNERFTFLVDDMPGENYIEKLENIAKETDISFKSLRKYYLAENDIDYVYDAKIKRPMGASGEYEEVDANQNRVTEPKKNLNKLADYFNCTPEYLLGKSNIYDREIAKFLSEHSEYGLTEDMLIGLKEINQLDNKRVYHNALNVLFQNYAFDNSEKEPYHLLYLLGKYLNPLSNLAEVTLSPVVLTEIKSAISTIDKIATDAKKQLSSYELTQKNNNSILEIMDNIEQQLASNSTLQVIDYAPFLIDIQNELQHIRSQLDIVQHMAISYLILEQFETKRDSSVPSTLTDNMDVSMQLDNIPIKE